MAALSADTSLLWCAMKTISCLVFFFGTFQLLSIIFKKSYFKAKFIIYSFNFLIARSNRNRFGFTSFVPRWGNDWSNTNCSILLMKWMDMDTLERPLRRDSFVVANNRLFCSISERQKKNCITAVYDLYHGMYLDTQKINHDGLKVV